MKYHLTRHLRWKVILPNASWKYITLQPGTIAQNPDDLITAAGFPKSTQAYSQCSSLTNITILIRLRLVRLSNNPTRYGAYFYQATFVTRRGDADLPYQHTYCKMRGTTRRCSRAHGGLNADRVVTIYIELVLRRDRIHLACSVTLQFNLQGHPASSWPLAQWNIVARKYLSFPNSNALDGARLMCRNRTVVESNAVPVQGKPPSTFTILALTIHI